MWPNGRIFAGQMDTRVDGAFIRELLLRERNEVTDEYMRDRQASHCGACALEPNIARPVRPSSVDGGDRVRRRPIARRDRGDARRRPGLDARCVDHLRWRLTTTDARSA